jgi:hypothetical protein
MMSRLRRWPIRLPPQSTTPARRDNAARKLNLLSLDCRQLALFVAVERLLELLFHGPSLTLTAFS